MIARPYCEAFIALWLYFHKQACLVPDSLKLRVDKQGTPYLVTLVTVFFSGEKLLLQSCFSVRFRLNWDAQRRPEKNRCVKVLFINSPGSVY